MQLSQHSFVGNESAVYQEWSACRAIYDHPVLSLRASKPFKRDKDAKENSTRHWHTVCEAAVCEHIHREPLLRQRASADLSSLLSLNDF